MMSNLFSIFDPSTNLYFSNNWISSSLNLFMLPLIYWMKKSRILILLFIILNKLYNEFKIIFLNKFNYINIIYFISLFFMIILNNFMGLYPYIFTSSSHLIFSLSFSIPMWLSLMIFNFSKNLNNTFAHMIPQGTPIFLMPFMVLIESISNIIRPLTLAIRLSANMIAGHLLLTLLSESINNSNYLMMTIIILIQIILLTLEFSVSIIQAYVFSILSTLYTKETN